MQVRYFDGKWVNGAGVYFDILKEINDDLINLINCDFDYEKTSFLLFFRFAVNFNRIFPLKGKEISKIDGILRLKEHFDFILEDYLKIYKQYKEDILIINDLRNKFEHVPHIIKWRQYIGDNKEKRFLFINEEYQMDIFEGNIKEIKIKKKRKDYTTWKIDTTILVKIVVLINQVFIKVQNKFKEYFKDNKEALEHPYINRIINMELTNYIKELNDCL